MSTPRFSSNNTYDNNWNVDFVEKTPFWGFYLTSILATRVFISLVSVELIGTDLWGWTITSVIHGIVRCFGH